MFTNEKCAQVKGPQLSLRSDFLKTLLQNFCPTVQVFLSNIQRRHESKSSWQPGSTIHIKDVCTTTLQLRRTGTQTPGRRGASGEHFSCKRSWRFFPRLRQCTRGNSEPLPDGAYPSFGWTRNLSRHARERDPVCIASRSTR